MKKTYSIEVDCAVCANKIEKSISKMQGVMFCSVNFITQKMIFEAADDEYDQIFKKAVKQAKKIEPEFEIEE